MEGARPEPEPGPGAGAAPGPPEQARERAPQPPGEPTPGQTPQPAPGPVPGPPAEAARPADPAPLGVTRTPTGVADVDTWLDRLADADHLAASGHLEVYEDVHRGLRDALTALDRRPGPPAPAPPAAP